MGDNNLNDRTEPNNQDEHIKMDDFSKMDDITRFNTKINNAFDPGKIYESTKKLVSDAAGVSMIEGEVLIDRTGKILSETVDRFGDTFHKHYNDFVNTTKNAIIDIIRENKKITGIQPMNKRNNIIGGGDDFMKYVYTAKPIWFTKKDMIWN